MPFFWLNDHKTFTHSMMYVVIVVHLFARKYIGLRHRNFFPRYLLPHHAHHYIVLDHHDRGSYNCNKAQLHKSLRLNKSKPLL